MEKAGQDGESFVLVKDGCCGCYRRALRSAKAVVD